MGQPHDDPTAHEHDHDTHHVHDHHGPYHESGHGHSHGLIDPSILRSREGVKAVTLSLGLLGIAALAQTLIFVVSGSVALLADLIHNFGDALTAIPLGIAFLLHSFRGEKLAGRAVVAVIFFSACVALYETIQRLLHPQTLTHLWVLAAAGVIGFVGNELAAQVRLRAGRRLSQPRSDRRREPRPRGRLRLPRRGGQRRAGLQRGVPRADPLIGLAITVVILKITWDSWRIVSTTEPGETLTITSTSLRAVARRICGESRDVLQRLARMPQGGAAATIRAGI